MARSGAVSVLSSRRHILELIAPLPTGASRMVG